VTDPSLEGAFRVDANISLAGGSRVEVKNIGSVKDVEKALSYEIIRQRNILERGGEVRRETRHWDAAKGVTVPLRSKEFEEDYRYFPDPDLPPLTMSKEFIESIAKKLPELPDARIERFMKQYGLDEYRSSVLVLIKGLADFFEECAKSYDNYKKLADLLITDFLRWVKEFEIDFKELRVKPETIVKLLQYLDRGTISIKMVKESLPKIIKDGLDVDKLVAEGYTKIDDEALLERVAREAIEENPKAVRDALENPKALNYLVGMVMKKTRGRADPSKTVEILKKLLEGYREKKS